MTVEGAIIAKLILERDVDSRSDGPVCQVHSSLIPRIGAVVTEAQCK